MAKKIKEIIESKFQVYDTKKKAYRDVMYKDIVILLRSTKEIAPIYEKEILKLDMPVFSDASTEYLDSVEIHTIMSVLKIIDNPLADIPLVAVLRSPIFGFTDNDLVQIRLADQYDNFYNCLLKAKLGSKKDLRKKIDMFLEQIEEWRKEKEFLALDELIWKIYTDTGYYNYVGLMPNGDLRQANLKMLFERAKQYESASFKGLFNFIKFIEKLQLGSGDLGSAKLIGENENVIRIMSIHKSKGLEFPIVFLSSTCKQFNLRDLNDNILLHQDIGLGVKYIDYDRQIEYDTMSKTAIRSKLLTETLSEEMRVLYVALTRAKEKLIITGVSKDFDAEISKMKKLVEIYKKDGNKINPVLVKKYKRYIDWILLVYLYNEETLKDIVSLNVKDKKDVLEKAKKQEEGIDVAKILENEKVEKSDIEKVKELIEYEYKYKESISIPTKTSVTKIKEIKANNMLEQEKIARTKNCTTAENSDGNASKPTESLADEKNSSNANETTEVIAEAKSSSCANETEEAIFAKPKFLNDSKEEIITSAQRGTLVHLCMQKLDEHKKYSKQDIIDLIKELETKEIITKKEAESINYSKVYNFTTSSIWNELIEAKEVYRERPFYINIPAKDIYEIETDENVLVQGIIDLYYIDKDDNLVLVDYKTDYVEVGEEGKLVDKYKEQLLLYKTALEEAMHRKVSKTYIYSVALNKAINAI